jgi:hypothetical protein
MTGDEHEEMIDKLKRLRAQVELTIVYIESGMPMFTVDPSLQNYNDTPDTFHIGDFTIRNRFTEPH